MHWELRCRFCARGRQGRGRKLAVGPNGPVFEVLFFPDGDGALESIDGEAARVEGCGAVRRADGDKHTGFANFEPAEPVGHGEAMDAIFFVKLRADFAHLGERHGLVSFVVEIERRAVVGFVADETVEGDRGAVFGCAHVVNKPGRVDALAYELENVFVKRGGHTRESAATDWWEEGNFVAGAERSVPGGKLLVAGSHDRRAVFGELGHARSVRGKKLLNR